MRVVRTFLFGLLVFSLSSCGLLDLDWLFGREDHLVPVEFTDTAAGLASQSILTARPMASALFTDQVSLLGFITGMTGNLADQVESGLFESSGDRVIEECPYLEPSGVGSSLRCNDVRDVAASASLLLSSPIVSSVFGDVTSGRSLSDGEEAFVSAWTHQAVISGIDTGAIQTVQILRALSICDDSPDAYERAFLLGEQQGMALYEQTEAAVLAEVPDTQCNTDVIANTILAEARANTGSTSSICEGYSQSQLAESVDLGRAESDRLDGLNQGLESAYEVARVRLVSTWVCRSYETEVPETPEPSEPPPELPEPSTESDSDKPPPGEPSYETSSDPCRCFARYWGDGPVYCFLESQYSPYPPRGGGELADMATRGVPQCSGSGNAYPVGSPLVADLDNNGVTLSTRETVSFDLAGTGELVRIPALTGTDAFLVLDLDGNGNIDSGVELFGNNSSCGERICTDGVEALSFYDENGDQHINSLDAVFSQLQLWQDANLDGLSIPGELTTLASAGIVAIATQARLDLSWSDALGNSAMRALNFTWLDGSEGVMHDVWFSLSFDQWPTDPRSSGIISTFPNRYSFAGQ